MCGPAIPIILAAASAVSAVSQFQQSRAQAKQYERQATVARQQAVVESQRQQRDIQRRLGTLHATTATAGIQSGSGSPLDLAADFTGQAELETFDQIRRGLLDFQDLRSKAKQTRTAAGANLISDALNIGSSVTGAFAK